MHSCRKRLLLFNSDLHCCKRCWTCWCLINFAGTAQNCQHRPSNKTSEGKALRLREFTEDFIFSLHLWRKKTSEYSCGTSEMIVNVLWRVRWGDHSREFSLNSFIFSPTSCNFHPREAGRDWFYLWNFHKCQTKCY